MDAIVLAGGWGTRGRSRISEVPGPMAPVGGVPFLDILLEKLLAHSIIKRIVLTVGCKDSTIQDYFGNCAYNRKIVYAVEKSPLGTGGSILNALAYTRSQEVLVLKGDTLFDVNIHDMVDSHRQRKADLTLALKPMCDIGSYGTVHLNQHEREASMCQRIIGFEKKCCEPEGLVNSGVYLLNQTLFDGLPKPLPHRFSFESDFIEAYFHQLNVYGFISNGNFVNISIPADYRQAQQALSKSSYARTA
ncbi:MAG: sugar phosphate nucleotidyltransferase [Cyanobacteria bacterium P01_D01_bin.105]